MKYVIISNRLPVTLAEQGQDIILTRSSGGLATGLDSLVTRREKHWIGWPGLHVEDASEQSMITAQLHDQLLHPVYLSPDQIQDYYERYSNSTLWPLCHYFFNYVEREAKYWAAYKEVNETYCHEALKVIKPRDIVWIHNYHLMLLPAMIREHCPDVAIGYFHHIPFPSYEMFRCLPERAEILRGLLGANLIGFHVHDYMRHFISCLYRVLNKDCQLDEVQVKERVAEAEAFPMGINYTLYNEGPTTPEAVSFAEELRNEAGDSKIILSVDRVDYSKGILLRLKSFSNFMEHNPDYRGKVTLIMVVAPSRDNVEKYADLKTSVDKIIGSINGAYAAMGWMPVRYFYHSFSFAELAVMYNLAAVALVTPLRDGMNMVAKEFLPAKRDPPGVLILSEMAGAAVELSDAIIINHTDSRQIEKAILQALTMPEEEQVAIIQKKQKVIARQDVGRWTRDFLTALSRMKKRNIDSNTRQLEKPRLKSVLKAYAQSDKRLLNLDDDGTLMPIVKNPEQTFPSQDLLDLLSALISDPCNKVVISSGRDMSTIESWLGDLGLDMIAKHGVFFREGGTWSELRHSIGWKEEILGMPEQATDKTPHSRIESKRTALVWHYREVDPWLADLRVPQLIASLVKPCTRLGLRIMHGNKIVEIKSADYNKGTAVQRLLQNNGYGLILTMGDDVTDKDMSVALPEDAVTIKVGRFSDAARYYLPEQGDVCPLLARLVRSSKFDGGRTN